METEKKTLNLGYWNIRGLAEGLRLLMEYLEVPYTQTLYKTADKGVNWFSKDKPEM